MNNNETERAAFYPPTESQSISLSMLRASTELATLKQLCAGRRWLAGEAEQISLTVEHFQQPDTHILASALLESGDFNLTCRLKAARELLKTDGLWDDTVIRMSGGMHWSDQRLAGFALGIMPDADTLRGLSVALKALAAMSRTQVMGRAYHVS